MPDPTLLCPTCREEMRKVSLRDMVIDECPYCDGLWFDDQEPEQLVSRNLITEHPLQPIAFDDSRKAVPPGQRRCPRCDLVMEVHPAREVKVDICPECRGLWLDRWELQKLLAD